MDAFESPPPPPAGQVGRYRIERRLGAGGMGVVYLGRDEATGRPAAVKLIRAEYASEPQLRARLRREVAAASRVPRFCTAPVLDADLDAQQPWIATEYVDAPTLDAALLERGRLAGDALASFAVGVAVALRAIHQHGVVHRDLKPSNILLPPVGPRVIDFGIAQVEGARTQLTRAGALLGTPAYMAPEQLRGEPVTAAVDVFAWAGLVVYAATGRPPFGGGGLPLSGILHDPPDLGDLSGPLRVLVAGALAKDPTARPTAADLVDRLCQLAPAAATRVIASATTLPPPPSPPPSLSPPPPRPARPRRRRRLAALVAALTATVALAVTAGVLAAVGADDPPPTGNRTRAAELATEARRTFGSDPPQAMALALDAWAEAETEPARSALLSTATAAYAGRFGTVPGGISVTVDPAGTVVAVGYRDGTVRLWDVANREPLGDPLTGHDGPVYWTQFSPDGSLVATGSLDSDDRGLAGVRVWEVPSGRLVTTLPGTSSVVWPADGQTVIASALPPDEDGVVNPSLAVWDVRTGRRLATFPTGDLVSDSALSPDGAWIAGSRLDGSIGVWRIDDGELVAELPPPAGGGTEGEGEGEGETSGGADTGGQPSDGPARGTDSPSEAVKLAFSPTGELARVDEGGEITLWELPEASEPRVIDDGSNRTIGNLVFTPDGYLYATGTGATLSWHDPAGDLQGGRLVGAAGAPQDLAVSADGKLVVAAGLDGPITMWRRATYRLPHRQAVTDVAFHPEGGRLATATADGAVREWDTTVPAVAATHRHPSDVHSVAYAPDGTRASVSADGTLRLHGPSGVERARLRVGGGREAHDVVFSPDGEILAVAASPPLDPPEGADPRHRIVLWDTATLQRRGTLDLGQARAHGIAFTQDGERLLAATYRSADPIGATPGESTLRRWRVLDQIEEPAVDLGEPQVVHLAVSPDGQTVAVGGTNRTVQLYRITGAPEAREFGDHPAAIRQVAFSPDGRTLATVTTGDTLVRLWDVATGELLAGLSGHLEAPSAVTFSPDGRTLASGGPDGDVMLWPTDPDDAVSRLCEALRGGSPGDPPHRLCP